MSLGNKKSEESLMSAQSFLNVLSIFLVIIAFQWFRLKQRKIDMECDENDIQASDYVAVISDLPTSIPFEGKDEDFDYAEILRTYLEDNLIQGKHFKIERVGLSFNSREIESINIKINSLIIKKQAHIITKSPPETLNSYDKQIEDLVQLKKAESQKYFKQIPKEIIKQKFTGFAYIIFENEKDKEEVLKFYDYKPYIERVIMQAKNEVFQFYGSELFIEQAPDPNNVYWSNLKFTREEKHQRRIICLIITVLSLGACLGIILGLTYAQKHASELKELVSISLISIAISVCISILNPILRTIIITVAQMEGRTTHTSVFASIAIRSSFAQFLNTSIFLILTQVFITGEGSIYGKIFGSAGFSLNINTVFLTQMLVNNLMKLINIGYIIKEFTRQGLKKFSEKVSIITQSQLNSLFEDAEFNIADEYAYNLSIIYSSLFYSPIYPMCLVWGIISLTLKFWIDKFNLIKRSSVKFNPSLHLCLQMTEMLELSLPLFSLSNMLAFFFISHGPVSNLSIFGFLVGVIHAILPMQILNEKLFQLRERKPNLLPYHQAKETFNTDYDRENPCLRDVAIERFFKEHNKRILESQDPSTIQANLKEKETLTPQGIKFSMPHNENEYLNQDIDAISCDQNQNQSNNCEVVIEQNEGKQRAFSRQPSQFSLQRDSNQMKSPEGEEEVKMDNPAVEHFSPTKNQQPHTAEESHQTDRGMLSPSEDLLIKTNKPTFTQDPAPLSIEKSIESIPLKKKPYKNKSKQTFQFSSKVVSSTSSGDTFTPDSYDDFGLSSKVYSLAEEVNQNNL